MLYVFLFFILLVLLFVSSYFLTQSLSALFYRITKSQKITVMLLALLFFPGVVIHELAHFFMASLLFVPTGEIEFMPQIHGDRVKLGSVQVGLTDPIRRALIGLAPVLVGAGALLGVVYYFLSNPFLYQSVDWLRLSIVFYVVFELSNTMFSSRRDIEGTVELILALLIIFFLLFLLGVRIPQSTMQFMFSPQVTGFFATGGKLLLFPLLFNLGILGISRLLLRR